jgi:hypothetical protein
MARQKGIRVKLELFIPYTDGLDSIIAAATAAKNLGTKEGLSGLQNVSGVEIESYETKETSRMT